MAASSSRLIVGLGNPGDEYAGTRHNIGFAVVDAVAARRSVEFGSEQPGAGRWLNALIGSTNTYDEGWGKWRGRSFGLVKPMTYMNRSGGAVARVMKKYGLAPQDVLVVLDDLSLPVGAVRLRKSGGGGGHNGLEDILDALNSDNLPRMRIGIGDNFERGQQSRYVLSPFSEAEQPIVDETLTHACNAALTFVSDGIVTAMNRYNRKASPLSSARDPAPGDP